MERKSFLQSDHDTDSEVEGVTEPQTRSGPLPTEGNEATHQWVSPQPSSSSGASLPNIPDEDDETRNEYRENSEGNSGFFIKTIHRKRKIGKKLIKEVAEVHKWKKKPIRSKCSRTPRKNLLKITLPSSRNCSEISDELSAFQKFFTLDMFDIIVLNTNKKLENKTNA